MTVPWCAVPGPGQASESVATEVFRRGIRRAIPGALALVDTSHEPDRTAPHAASALRRNAP